MKKSKKYLLVVLAFLLVLGGGIAVLQLTKAPEPEDSESSGMQGSIVLFERTIYDLKTVSFEKKGESEPITVEVSTDEENNLSYKLQGKSEKIPLKATILQSLGVYGYQLKATKDLGVQEDLTQFGLTDPALCITSVFNDGDTKKYYVGAANPAGGYYVQLDGDEKLYTALISETAFSEKKDLIDTSLITVNTTSQSGGQVTVNCVTLRLGGENHDPNIVIEKCDPQIHSNYLLKQPAQGQGYYCNDEAVNDKIKASINITAKEVMCIEPTAEQLAAYGLDKPKATFDFTMEILDGTTGESVQETHKIQVSTRYSNGTYPALIDDIPVVFAIPSSAVESWYQAEPFSFRSPFVILPMLNSLSGIEVETPEGKHNFTQTRKAQEGDAASYDYTIYNTEKQELTYTVFQKYYKTLLGLTLMGETQEQVSGDPLLRVTYRYFEGGQDELAYYTSAENPRQCVVVLNGAVYGTVRKSNVDESFQHAANMENDICEMS